MTDDWIFIAQMGVFYAGAVALGAFAYWLSRRETKEYDRKVAARRNGRC